MAAPLTVRSRRVQGASVAAVRVWLCGGSRHEEVPGQALLAGRHLAEGTEQRDWRQIAGEAEARGMAISSSAGYEVQIVAVDALAGDWQTALDWSAELVLESTFSADRHELLVEQAQAELESLDDHPEVRTGRVFLSRVYGSHPRGRPLQGSLQALAELEPGACAEFHRRAAAQGCVIAVAGEIDEELVIQRARELFGGLQSLVLEAVPLVEPLEPSAPAQLANSDDPATGIVELPPGDQAHLFVGALTVERRDPDYPVLEVLGVVLGDGPGLMGRLPRKLREDEGLAYDCSVGTVQGSGLDRGLLEIHLSTDPDAAGRAELLLRQELARVVADGITSEELEEARAYLLGREPFRRETARQWAPLLGESELYGLPVDDPDWFRARLEAVQMSEIERVARHYLDDARLITTLGRPGR